MRKKLILLFFLNYFFVFPQQQKWYLNSSVGQPWGSTANQSAMNMAFGAGIWNQGYFESVNVNALLQPSVCMIFMDGSDNNANSFNNFLASNLPAIQNWVYAGGQLYLNAAPNQGGNINYSFGGVMLNYTLGTGPYSNFCTAAPGMSTHPVTVFPYNPAGYSFTGNFLGQGFLTGPIVPILTGTPGTLLGDKFHGSGHVYFGAETTTNWHSPQPNAINFRANVLSTLGACCGGPQYTVSASLTSTSICTGQNVTITPSGAPGPYTLFPGGQTGTVFVVSPTVSTYYNAIYSSTLGCQQGVTFRILVSNNAAPSLSVSGNTLVCSGGTVNLTASGANSYSWSTGALTSTIATTPSVSTVYTVIGTATNGCTGMLTQSVQVNPAPSLSISGNVILCSGGAPLQLTANGATSYTWSTGALTNTMTDSPVTNTVYTVAGTNSLGCTSSMSQAVSYNPSPTVSISGGTAAICAGNSVTLTASGANFYSWSNGNQSAVIVVSPTASTVYSVVGTSVPCSGSAFQSVTVIPVPALVISGNSVICSGQSTTLTATGANSYTWSNGPQSNSIVVSPSLSTNYSVAGTGSTNCTGNVSQNIVVNPNPSVSISGQNLSCSGAAVTLTASGAASYSWSNGFLTQSISVSPSVATVYSVIGTSSAACAGTATFAVQTGISPTVTVIGNNTICAGQSTTLNASGANSYLWNNASFSNSIVVSPSISTGYTATGTSPSGCTGAGTIYITVNALPVLTVTGGGTLCSGQSATLNASGALTYTWDGGSNSNSIVVSPTVNSTYTVTGTSSANCTGSASTVNVAVIICTGVNEISASGVSRVFPNPASRKITVESKVFRECRLSDLSGRILTEGYLEGDKMEIDLQNFDAGIYFIQLKNAENTTVFKIIKL